MSIPFHEKIKLWREDNNLSILDMARMLREYDGLEKCSRQIIVKWDKKGYYPSGPYCAALEDLMGASWAYLYFDNPWPPEGVAGLDTVMRDLSPDRRKVVLDLARALRSVE